MLSDILATINSTAEIVDIPQYDWKLDATVRLLQDQIGAQFEPLSKEVIEATGVFKYHTTNGICLWYKASQPYSLPGPWEVKELTLIHDPAQKRVEITGEVKSIEETFYNSWCETKNDLDQILWGIIRKPY